MKLLKSIMLGTAVMAIFGVANATPIKGIAPFSSNYVLKTYVAAITEGNITDFDKIFADNATFTVGQGKDAVKMSKEEVINTAKINEGIKQDCTASINLFKESKDAPVYEVDIKYADYTKINYITMTGSDDAGWKIADIKTITQ